LTRISSPQHLITANFLKPKLLSSLDAFTEHQSNFKLDKDERNATIKEVVKQSLNYDHHFPWNALDIITNENNNTFEANRKTKTPIPPPNTPAPPEEMISDNEMQSDCSAETQHACTPIHMQTQTNTSNTNTNTPSHASNFENQSTLRQDNQLNTNESYDMEIDDQVPQHEPVPQLNNPTITSPLSWADETNNHPPGTQNSPTTSNTPISNSDIRSKNPISQQSKIIELCHEVDQCPRNAEAIVNLFIKIKEDSKNPPKTSLKGILSKINHKDRDFFRTFARNDLIKGQHQIEYEKLEKEFHSNYLKANNIGYITRSTRKKIRIIINKALFITYLRSSDLTTLKFWQIAQLLDYGFNFFIDPSLPKINYQELCDKCEELIKMKLPNLPENPEDIPKSIKIKLPKAIPITSFEFTGEIAQSLRAFYNFDLLPKSYFIQRPNLPENPSDLKPELKRLFPLTQRSELKDLKKFADQLRDHYYVPSKLPDSYFQLPPPKKPLPPSYKDLPPNITKHFPVDNNSESIHDGTEILRENNFAVRRLPLDYIKVRHPLPPAHWFSENNAIILPINQQEEVKNLITTLKEKFFFKLPLGPEWIKEGLTQLEKPKMPDNFNYIEEELGITKEQLHRESEKFTEAIRKIKASFSGKIPNEWISPLLPELPNLNEAINHLKAIKSSINLPLLEDQNFSNNIKILRNTFYFEKLPPNFINEPESPDPELVHLPNLF
jgi:hypothetical protein